MLAVGQELLGAFSGRDIGDDRTDKAAPVRLERGQADLDREFGAVPTACRRSRPSPIALDSGFSRYRLR
jgi:hypothetical protein